MSLVHDHLRSFMPKTILLLNGPNINLLGCREPSVYGLTSYEQIVDEVRNEARALGANLEALQTNHEGVLIDRIHAAAAEAVDAIIINPGGLTHTSVSLRDALTACNIAFYEVHMTNIHAREPFRRTSLLSDVAAGCVCGLGAHGYLAALRHALSDAGTAR